MKARAARWLWLGVCSALSASTAHAQDAPTAPVDTSPQPVPGADGRRKAEAEQSRLHALNLYDSGDYAGARAEFARANQLVPSYRLLYNLGVVSLDLADPASAYGYFERFLAEGGELVPPEKRSETLNQLHELSVRIATVIVHVNAPSAEILVDERSMGTSPLAVRLNPGTHGVRARYGRESSQTKELELRPGDSLLVELRIAPAHARTSLGEPQRQIFWPAWAATAALTAGAAIAGFEALSAQHEYTQRFDTITSRGELDRLDRSAARWSITADALGGAAVVAGAYSLYLSLRHTPPRASSANGLARFSVQVLSDQARATVSF